MKMCLPTSDWVPRSLLSPQGQLSKLAEVSGRSPKFMMCFSGCNRTAFLSLSRKEVRRWELVLAHGAQASAWAMLDPPHVPHPPAAMETGPWSPWGPPVEGNRVTLPGDPTGRWPVAPQALLLSETGAATAL